MSQTAGIPATVGILALLMGAAAGCTNYVAFEGCSADVVCRAATGVLARSFSDVRVRPGAQYVASTLHEMGSEQLRCRVDRGLFGRTTVHVQYTERGAHEMILGGRPGRMERIEADYLKDIALTILDATKAHVVDSSIPVLLRLRLDPVRQGEDRSEAVVAGLSRREIVEFLQCPEGPAGLLVPSWYRIREWEITPAGLRIVCLPHGAQRLVTLTFTAEDGPEGVRLSVASSIAPLPRPPTTAPAAPPTVSPLTARSELHRRPVSPSIRTLALRKALLMLKATFPGATVPGVGSD